MRSPRSLFFLTIVLFLAAACRKEGDGTPPVVRIVAPAVGTLLQVPDSLLVRVEVSDDRVVREVTLALMDPEGVPAAATLAVSVNAREALVERVLPVQDERLRTGQYKLQVRASDGENETNAFRTVALNEAPLRLRGIFAVGLPGGAPTTVYFVDSVFQPGPFGSFGQDLRFAGISSRHAVLFLAGGQTGPFSVVDPVWGNTRWSVGNQMPGLPPYFSSLDVSEDGEYVYIGSEDGLLRGYRSGGGQQFTANTLPQHRLQRVLLHDEVVVSAQRDIALPQRRLVTYWRSSGVQAGAYDLDMDVVGMYRAGGQHALLFGNRNGQGVVQHRHVYQGGGWEPRIFDGGEIQAVTRLGNNTWLVALPGTLLRYRYPDNSVLTLATPPGTVRQLAYDPATGSVVAALESSVALLDANTGMVVQQVEIGMPVGFALPWRNR
jgi:hypothetical protein